MSDLDETRVPADTAYPAPPEPASMERINVAGRLGAITELLRDRVADVVDDPPVVPPYSDAERTETINQVARRRFTEFRDQWTALADADRMSEADDLLDQLFCYFREREPNGDNDDNFLMKHGFNMFIRNEDPRFLQAIVARFTERPDADQPHNQDLVSKAHEFGARHCRVRGTTLMGDEQTAEAGRRLIEQARETLRALITTYEERGEFGSACRAAYETAYTFVPQERWGEAHLYFRISGQMAEKDPEEVLGQLIAINEQNYAMKMGGTMPAADVIESYRQFTRKVRELAARGNPTAKRWVSNALHEQGTTALEIAQAEREANESADVEVWVQEVLLCTQMIIDDEDGYLAELDEQRIIVDKATELREKALALQA